MRTEQVLYSVQYNYRTIRKYPTHAPSVIRNGALNKKENPRNLF
jgi:hypothetical protein